MFITTSTIFNQPPPSASPSFSHLVSSSSSLPLSRVSTACLALCSPYLQVFTLVQVQSGQVELTVCKADWPKGWEKTVIVLVVLLTYVIPLAVIVVSYTLILRFLWRHRIGTRKTADSVSASLISHFTAFSSSVK